MNICAIIQARTGSSRFPNKIMHTLVDGQTVLEYLLNRLSTSTLLDQVIVATTVNPNDDKLVDWLQTKQIPYFRGDDNDCLDRISKTCQAFNVDVFVRITSDCPLVIPTVVDDMVKYYLFNKEIIDYFSNRVYTNFPKGTDVEIIPSTLLHFAADNAVEEKEREHINYFFLDRPEKYKIRYYNHQLKYDLSSHKFAIDTPNDLENVKQLFNNGLSLNFDLAELASVLINNTPRSNS